MGFLTAALSEAFDLSWYLLIFTISFEQIDRTLHAFTGNAYTTARTKTTMLKKSRPRNNV